MRHPEPDRAWTAKLEQAFEQLPYEPPSAERAQQIRTALLTTVRDQPVRRTPRALPFLAAAAAIAAVAFLLPRPEPPFERGRIVDEDGASFVHAAGGRTQPEIVRLKDGTLRLRVQKLAEGERFIVETDDAEVEVRGTMFTVTAKHGALERVGVSEGRVEVRSRGRPPILVGAGESWHPRRPPAVVRLESPPPKAAPKPKAKPKKRAQVVLHPKPTPTTPEPAEERAFRDAWSAFARGDMSIAADLFQEAERGELAEDARYGRALALQRAGRLIEAQAEMERYLALHPHGRRTPEVAVALGWILLKAGDLESARQRFEQGRASKNERVRHAAERGLRELDARAPSP